MKFYTTEDFFEYHNVKVSAFNDIEKSELFNLLQEVMDAGFTQSYELSRYIVKEQLGYKYPNISGIITMKNSGDCWDFKGGFPPKVYGIICSILGLTSKRTQSRVIKFQSFASCA